MFKPKGLGRGLASLIPSKKDVEIEETKITPPIDLKEANLEVLLINPENIEFNPHQPRKNFNEDELTNLANSIRDHGILQPLVVIKIDQNNYQLVAGERRLRAAKILGLKEVPVIVRQAEDLEKIELSLIENIQRQDLNPIEEAEAYQKLSTEFALTQEEIAKRVGKKRSTIANIMRLLQLADEIKRAITENKITLAHAKVILEAPDQASQLRIFNKILESNLTVKESEREVRKIQVQAHQRIISDKDARILNLEEKLREFFGQKVNINKRGARGNIIIDFYSEEELIEIIRKIIK